MIAPIGCANRAVGTMLAMMNPIDRMLSVPAGDYRITGDPPKGSGAWAGAAIVTARQPTVRVLLVLPPTP